MLNDGPLEWRSKMSDIVALLRKVVECRVSCSQVSLSGASEPEATTEKIIAHDVEQMDGW